jgi:hypothetical protein
MSSHRTAGCFPLTPPFQKTKKNQTNKPRSESARLLKTGPTGYQKTSVEVESDLDSIIVVRALGILTNRENDTDD